MTHNNTIPNADFSYVRYANCWEDADVLIEGLKPTEGKRFLSIASAGDNSLSLLSSGAEVIAADLNETQLACAELRKEAIRIMSQPDFLEFSGIHSSGNRQSTYNRIRSNLSEDAQQFWDNKPEVIQNGFIHAGKFENYFWLFRTRIMPLIHSRKTINRLLSPKTPEERNLFYQNKWNNRRWRLLFHFFFGRRMMEKHGRSPEFFKHVEGSVADRILSRTEYALTQLDTSSNPYLTYILTGNFGKTLPHYLVPEVYENIQKNIDRLTIRHGAIDSIAEQYGPDSFDGFNLSDIFEYLSEQECETVYTRLLNSAKTGARLAYWNMLVPRMAPASQENRINRLEDQARQLFDQDRAFFYSRFVLEEVR